MITVSDRLVGVGVFSATFPVSQFDYALHIQAIYNELYCGIAEDEEWLYNTTKDLILAKPLPTALWGGIYEEAKKSRVRAGHLGGDLQF